MHAPSTTSTTRVALRDRGQSVETDAVLGRDLLWRSLLEAEPAKGQEEPVKQEREHRLEGAAGRPHPHGAEDAVEDRHALVRAAREEQLSVFEAQRSRSTRCSAGAPEAASR